MKANKLVCLAGGAVLVCTAAGNVTTNVAFGDGEKDLYVTVAKDANNPQANGGIVKISNIE